MGKHLHLDCLCWIWITSAVDKLPFVSCTYSRLYDFTGFCILFQQMAKIGILPICIAQLEMKVIKAIPH